MADMEEFGRPMPTIVDIFDELERTNVARVPEVLQQLENILEPEDEMLLAEGSRHRKKPIFND
ncbi:uncharacterized protein LOC108095133 [Drosophila ficusphila]|uniref:uncharacterized protein LOC108095133 n=1 Tax=Drosophila ficusphila TaxID=30025 RepID=UPI0007E65CED|nr:uncharacterized protein LOC108095133 [Drosophila ficusphila]